uniref:Flavodoxin-like domain-containing protein n=1 Tax=Parastrongyloides trichosuri TaxID=131310 RepID=A0A0N4ZMX8_PARTI
MNLMPNVERTPKRVASHQMTAFEAAVDYAERQDIFLYFTAFMGIFMPAAVYFLYMKVHNYYQEKWTKEAEIKKLEKNRKSRLKKSRRKLSCEDVKDNNNSNEKCEILKNFALDIKLFYTYENEEYDNYINDHIIPNLKAYKITSYDLSIVDVDEFLTSTGICLFFIETNEKGTFPDNSLWFLEWLEDYEKGNNKMRNINYAIFGISNTSLGGKIYQKNAKVLSNLLHRLEGNNISPITFGDLKKDGSVNDQLKIWIGKIKIICDKQIMLRKQYSKMLIKDDDTKSDNDEKSVTDDDSEDSNDEEDSDEDSSSKGYSDTENSNTDSEDDESKKDK